MEATDKTTTTAPVTAAEEAAKAAEEAAKVAKAKALEAQTRLSARLAAPRFHGETVLTVHIANKAELDIFGSLKLVDAVRGQLGTLASLALDNMSLSVRKADKDGGIKGKGTGTFESKETLGSQISRLTRECEKFAKATGIELAIVLSRSLDGEIGARLAQESKGVVS